MAEGEAVPKGPSSIPLLSLLLLLLATLPVTSRTMDPSRLPLYSSL